MAYVWPLSNTREFDDNGQLRDAKAYFYLAGTTTPLVVYTDSDLSIPHTSPVETNGTKRWPAVFLPFDTEYKVRVTTDTGVIVFEQDGLSTPPDVSGDDGGSSGVPTAERWQTGDLKPRYGTGTHAGFVRANGATIGSAASGATERANDDCEALFKHLWEADSSLEVSSGRGGSADDDWAANKTIATPNFQGRALVGLEGMGATVANVIQRSTTISTTNASTSATVGSATGLALGMYVVSDNVPDGTTITAISGTTVTLSQAATATASGTAARFSFFPDAQTLGAVGGSDVHAQVTAELAQHNHTGTVDSGGAHSHQVPTRNDNTTPHNHSAGDSLAAGTLSGALDSRNTLSGGAHVHTFTSNNTGSGVPHKNLQPSKLVTVYIKL